MKKVLVDTSIWIDFVRKNSFAMEILELINQDRLAICGVVKAELFPFFRKGDSPEKWLDYFGHIFHIPFKDDWWEEAIRLQTLLYSQHHDRLGISDLLILTLCIKEDLLLFAKDTDFLRTSARLGLKLYQT